MLDGYLSLPAWIRTILALAVLSSGTWMTFTGASAGKSKFTESKLPDGTVVVEEKPGDLGARNMFRLGMVCSGIGAAMLLVCGKTDAEKHGYNSI